MKSRRSNQPHHYQALEARQLLAGDVAVSLSGDTLEIIGDNAANEVRIVGRADGSAQVIAATGTTINGSTSPFSAAAGLKNVNVNLNGGDDVFSVHGLVINSNLNISGGSGADRISISDSNLRDLNFSTNDGNDVASLHNVYARKNIRIETGDNNDTLSITAMAAGGDVMLDTGAGNDTLAIDNLGTKNEIRIELGSGDDQALVTGETYGYRARINLAEGNDTLGLLPRTSGTTTTATFQRQLDVAGGVGDDSIGLDAGVNSVRKTKLDGQTGSDSIATNGAIMTSPTVDSFEATNVVNLNQRLDAFYASLTSASIDTTPFGRIPNTNQAPTLAINNTALTFNDDAPATPIDNQLTLTGDTTTVVSGATINIDANVAGTDVLGFTNTASITGTFDATTGTMTLTGPATLAEYQSALRTVTYDNTAATFTPGTKRVNVTVNSDNGTATDSRNITLQVLNEDQRIQNFLAANNLVAERTASGLYYIVETVGNGVSPTINDSVRVNYTGTLLDGSQFDANNNITFPLSNVIEGWQEGFPFFSEGGSGQLIIPSSLAYGGQTRPGIPANSILRFEIELLEVI